MRKSLSVLVGVMVVSLVGAKAEASLVTLWPSDDAEIMRSGNTITTVNNTNYGSLQYATINFSMPGGPTSSIFPNTSDSFGLVQFDLSAIPVGSTIESATFSLYAATVSGWSPTPGAVALYPVTSAWDETTVTYATRPSQSATSVGSLLFPNSSAGYRTLDVTGLVQDWFDGTVANYGLITSDVHRAAGNGRGYVRFYSKEAAGFNFDPRLDVTYTAPPAAVVPVPSAVMLAGTGLLLAGRLRKRQS